MKKIFILILVTIAIGSIYLMNFKPKKLETKEGVRVLKILAWEGYADPQIVKNFKERYGVDVDVTYVENDDALWDLVSQKKSYDLIAANTAEIERYISANLIIPLDLTLIPNVKNQDKAFSNLTKINGISANNKIFAIPYVYSEMGLIYNKKIINTPPKSLEIMWDKKYQGRVLAFNTYQHNFTLSAMLEDKKNPFRLTDIEINLTARKLQTLKENVLAFYTTLDEATSAFIENNVAIMFGNFGQQQVSDLIKNGADVGYVIPKEGALAWLDCWAITTKSQNVLLAHQWINFLLEEQNSRVLKTGHSLHHTLENLSEFTKGDKIIWLEPISNPVLRKELWDNIINNSKIGSK